MNIYVSYYLSDREHRYYVLDWAYEDKSTEFCKYEETELSEGLIKEMVEVNPDNLEFLGFFESENAVKEALEELKDDEASTYPIEYTDPGFYVIWDDGVVANALEALDVEYDAAWESGVWPAWVIGWSRDVITQPIDLVIVLEEFYGPYDGDTADFVEEFVKEAIAGKFRMSDDIRYHPIIDEILDASPRVGRIDPACLS